MAKLYFRYSAMNAGKSTALLQVAHNYEEQKQTVVVYTAEIDDRYGVGHVTSRLGPQRKARTFGPELDFWQALEKFAGLWANAAAPPVIPVLHTG